MSESFSHVERAQALWASQDHKSLEREGYVAAWPDNLLLGGLDEETRTEFEKADGAELRDSGGRPAKMRALVSSSALAANFFDSWRHVPKEPLANALKAKEPITALCFEHKCQDYPVGPRSPNLDLLLTLANGERVGIESKFVEPYRNPGVDSALSLKYYPSGVGHWRNAGLQRAQGVADKMRGTWDYLDTPQLLKHMLGLRSEQPMATVNLTYLWYDTGLDDAKDHRAEIERFGLLTMEDEVVFSAMSYQELFESLRRSGAEPLGGWAPYMSRRYFSTSEGD